MSESEENSQDEIRYIITKDPKLLKIYHKLRAKEYKTFLGILNFPEGKDAFDDKSIVAVALRGEKLIGGARLTIVTPEKKEYLPLEEKDFYLKELFPQLDLDNKKYCEISRFVVHQNERSRVVSLGLTKKLCEIALKAGCDYQFSISQKVATMNIRRIGKQIGVKHVTFSDIKVPFKPIYNGLNKKGIYLSVTYPIENESTNAVLFTTKSGKKEELVS